jgi:DNA-directed RNA polymerase II subunit RPB2
VLSVGVRAGKLRALCFPQFLPAGCSPFDIWCGVQVITTGLKYALATGNWGLKQSNTPPKAGVSQVLNRLTFAATLAHMRRLNTPIDKSGKSPKPRQLHHTQWGMLCPAETPEGQACGLIKNLSLMSYVSIGTPPSRVVEILREWGLENLDEIRPSVIPTSTKVFVNGSWVGVHRDPEDLVTRLRTMRRQLDIVSEVAIVRDIRDRELRIHTDAGRCMRPVFIVDSLAGKVKDETLEGEEAVRLRYRRKHFQKLQQPDYSWHELLKEGVVEYIDTEEEEKCMIAFGPQDLSERKHVIKVRLEWCSVPWGTLSLSPLLFTSHRV